MRGVTERREILVNGLPSDVFRLFLTGEIAMAVAPGEVKRVPRGRLRKGTTEELVYPLKLKRYLPTVHLRVYWRIARVETGNFRWVMHVISSSPFNVTGTITCHVQKREEGTVIVVDLDLPGLELVPGWILAKLSFEALGARIEGAMS